MNDREELIGFINDLEKEVYACIDSANKEKANDVFGQIKDRLQKNIHIYFAYPKHVMMQHNGIGMHVVDKE